jgi:hypothetical protein
VGGGLIPSLSGVLLMGVALAAILMAARTLARFLARRLFGLAASYTPTKLPSPQRKGPGGATMSKTAWEGFSEAKRKQLYDLARGRLPNPRNEEVICELLQDGRFVVLKPWPQIRSPNLCREIIKAVKPADLSAWQRAATTSTWRTVRTPLFVVLAALVGWLTWSAGGSMKIVSTILVGGIAFLGQLLQLFSLARSPTSAKPSGQQ